MNKETSIKKNAVLNAIKTIMGLLFPLITFPYVSRVLGPSGVGKVNFANSIISYFAMFAELGISTYGVREAAKYRNDSTELSRLVREILIINLLSTLIAYFLLFIAIFLVPVFYEYRKLLIICGGSIFFVTIGMNWLYTALEEFSYITIRSVFFQLISLVLLFCFVRNKDDYLIYAAIGVISSVGSNICNFIHSKKFISFSKLDGIKIKQHLKPIFTLFAMSIAVSIYTVLDTSMLGFIAGDEQVGLYTAATKINKIIISVISALSTVLLPRLSFYISQHDDDKFYELTTKALKFIILLSFPSTIGLTLVARPIVLLLCGNNYIPAISVMKIMNPIIIAISLSFLIGMQIFLPLGKEKITLLSVILGALVNFSLNLLLIRKYGAYGAGIATLCAESSVTLFQLFFCRKIIKWRDISIHMIQCLISCFVMVLGVIFISKISASLLMSLLLSIGTGVILYIFLLIVMRNQFFISLVREVIRK